MSIIKRKRPLVAIVGSPNVGKSTLFNRIYGKKRAIVFDKPGTTRDRVMTRVHWQNNYFDLMDTAGILGELEAGDMGEAVDRQIQEAMNEANILLLVIDGRTGWKEKDKMALRMIRKRMDKVILVINKVDSAQIERQMHTHNSFGLKKIYCISALSGKGVGDLLDGIVLELQKQGYDLGGDNESEEKNICIFGRTNVGKSTLLNSICGQERMVVSDAPGTTRDVGGVAIHYAGEDYFFLDTAGVRGAKILYKDKIERFGALRAVRALQRAQLAIIVLDGIEGLTKRDISLIGMVEEMKKAVVLWVNKWDEIKNDKLKSQDKWIENLRQKMGFFYWLPVVFGSAKEKDNLKVLMKKVKEVSDNYAFRIEDEELRILLEDLKSTNPRINKLMVKKIKQVDSKPPHFVVKVGNKKILSSGDERMLENYLRDVFQLYGVPLLIEFV